MAGGVGVVALDELARMIVLSEMGMVDVLVCGAWGDTARYPAEEGGRRWNRFLPSTEC